MRGVRLYFHARFPSIFITACDRAQNIYYGHSSSRLLYEKKIVCIYIYNLTKTYIKWFSLFLSLYIYICVCACACMCVCRQFFSFFCTKLVSILLMQVGRGTQQWDYLYIHINVAIRNRGRNRNDKPLESRVKWYYINITIWKFGRVANGFRRLINNFRVYQIVCTCYNLFAIRPRSGLHCVCNEYSLF